MRKNLETRKWGKRCQGKNLFNTAEDVKRLVNRIVEDINSFSKSHPNISERYREVRYRSIICAQVQGRQYGKYYFVH